MKAIAANAQTPVKGVRVQFATGQLEIHAHDATLSEVLFQIQKQTGAEIAIPAGTEQERVFVDLKNIEKLFFVAPLIPLSFFGSIHSSIILLKEIFFI